MKRILKIFLALASINFSVPTTFAASQEVKKSGRIMLTCEWDDSAVCSGRLFFNFNDYF